MTSLHEATTNAQILPRPQVFDQRRTITEWQAHNAIDADERTKHKVFRDIAGRLTVQTGTDE